MAATRADGRGARPRARPGSSSEQTVAVAAPARMYAYAYAGGSDELGDGVYSNEIDRGRGGFGRRAHHGSNGSDEEA